MISNNTYYELFASYTVPDHNRVGYWVDLGANSKGKVIKTYNENLKKWVKVTDATSEDAVAPFIGNNGNWWIDNRDTGVSASGQPPFIGNNDNWFTYDSSGNPVDTGKSSKGVPGVQGPKGDKGQDGKGFAVLGYYTTLGDLQSAISNPSAGDAYGVGSSMPYDIYIYDSVSNSWLNNGAIQGAKGEPGEKGEMGPAGKDATINGLNTINIVEGDNISITQTGDTLTISGNGGLSNETDPIFSASPAAKITNTNLSNWSNKQDKLVSGTNIKTINGTTILGSGDIIIEGGSAKDEIYIGEDEPTDGQELWIDLKGTEEPVEMLQSTITIDQTITDPATMISGDINGAAIQAIRSNSHRYLGKYTADGIMTVCQLDDVDSNKYVDGTTSDLTGAEGDVFMKMPAFWYKSEEKSTDIWNITFAYGSNPGDGWIAWDTNALIGVYEAYSEGNKLYSRSGVTSSGNISQANFKAYARNRGNGFRIVDWQMHCVMAILFYAQYGHTNCQDKIGKGTISDSNVCGQTNACGMNDTKGASPVSGLNDAGANGNSQSINFWGLENWWGNKYEGIDNVVINSRKWEITEPDGTVRKPGSGGTSSNYITKMLFGDCCDLIPTAATGSSTTGFCDNYNQLGSSSRVVLRSGSYSNASGGVACVSADIDSSVTSSFYGSRLAFRGQRIEETNVSTFKSLTAIG